MRGCFMQAENFEGMFDAGVPKKLFLKLKQFLAQETRQDSLQSKLCSAKQKMTNIGGV